MTSLTDEEEDIIFHARQAVLTDYDGNIWQKKKEPQFDVTMGAYDGAECCELVGLYLLKRIETIIGKDKFGLYRDDGLIAINGRGRIADRTRKHLIKIFQDEGLSITVEVNLTSVNFLDVTLNLQNESYKPFSKPNTDIRYVSKFSNHPPQVLKNVPQNINKRLSSISSSVGCFNEEKDVYQKALKEASYDHILHFNPDFSAQESGKIGRGEKDQSCGLILLLV